MTFKKGGGEAETFAEQQPRGNSNPCVIRMPTRPGLCAASNAASKAASAPASVAVDGDGDGDGGDGM